MFSDVVAACFCCGSEKIESTAVHFTNTVSQACNYLDMGGCISKQARATSPPRRPSVGHPGTGSDNNPTDEEPAEPRFVSCEETISTTLGRLQIRYGFISQRGYYPDGEFCRTFSTKALVDYDFVDFAVSNENFFFSSSLPFDYYFGQSNLQSPATAMTKTS